MKRPAFQFYPADWRNNANLGRCSPAARGIWVDILCVLHDSDEYGVVRWPLADVANAAHAPMKLIRELVDKNVLKGSDKQVEQAYVYTPRSGRRDGPPVTLVPIQSGPVWYSSRMVKDEHVRTIRGESSRFGDESGDEPKPTPKPSPKPPFGHGSSSSSSASQIHSEPNGSGGKPPAMSALEIIFGYGVPLLVSAGSTDKAARSFLGGLRKGHLDDELVDALRDCLKAKPLQPLEWLAAALPPRGSARSTQRHNGNAEPAWVRERRERTQEAAPYAAVGGRHAKPIFDIEEIEDEKRILPAP